MRRYPLAILSLFLCLLSTALQAIPLRILATGDMHGWIEAQPQKDGMTIGGPAEMLVYWQRVEGYTPESFLLASCGDIATGPAISTAFKGESAVEVMNRMGYDVSALGNHEFDYGRNGLLNTFQKAKFPFIAANLTNADGTPTDILPPTMIYEEQGVKVGIIGLTLRDITGITNTNGLVGQDYAPVVRTQAAELRQQGAQVLIVLSHLTLGDLNKLANSVADLNIALMLGGHSHEFGQMKIKNSWIVNNGEWWQGYTRIDMDFNQRTGKTVVLSAKQVWLEQENPAADEAVKAEVARWRTKLGEEYGRTLGYTTSGLTRPTAMTNVILGCWLAMFPDTDVAFSNQGGFRQDIPAGPITKESIFGVLPFTNGLYAITLTGEQMVSYKPTGEALSQLGIVKQGEQVILRKTGKPVDLKTSYRVVINDYLYNKSPSLKAADATPEVVAADWRQPVYDWFAQHSTSADNPVESLLGQ